MTSATLKGTARVIIPPMFYPDVGVRIEPFKTVEGVWRANFEILIGSKGFSSQGTLCEDGFPNERECVLAHLDRAIFYFENFEADDSFSSPVNLQLRQNSLSDLKQFRNQYSAREAPAAAGTVGRIPPARAPALGDPSKFAEGVAQVSNSQSHSSEETNVISKAKKPAKGETKAKGWQRSEDIVAGGREHLQGMPPPEVGAPAVPKPVETLSQSAKDAVEAAPGEFLIVPIEQVMRSPLNPRKTFNRETLEELARSFLESGIIQPLVVKPFFAGNYELIAGERRLQAAEIAGLTKVPIVTNAASDREIIILRLVENFDREDLNAVDTAKAFQEATTVGGWTQVKLSERLHISQPQIAHKIRLLKLPEDWLQLLITRRITETQAREAVAWVDYPAVLNSVKATALKQKEPMTTESFEHLLKCAIKECGRTMEPSSYNPEACHFKPTPAQTKELDIKVINHGHWKQRFAMNVKLWDELQKPALIKWQERRDKEENKPQRREPGREPTSAELKERAKKNAEQWAKRLYRWKIRWLQSLCAARLENASETTLLKLLLYYSVQVEANGRRGAFVKSLTAAGGKASGDIHSSRYSPWSGLAELQSGHLWRTAEGSIRSWIQHDVESWRSGISAPDVEGIAKELEVDVVKEWVTTEEYLELHSKDQLANLMREWGMQPPPASAKRGDLLKIIQKLNPTKCPLEVSKCKAVKL